MPIDYALYTKKDTTNFCLLVYSQSYNDKDKFSVLQTVQSNRNTFYLRTTQIKFYTWEVLT